MQRRSSSSSAVVYGASEVGSFRERKTACYVAAAPPYSTEARRKFDSRSSTRDVYLRHFLVRLLSQTTSMGRSPAISAGDYERPFGVCPAAKNSSLSQGALLHPEAIRDVLAPHAAGTYYCLELLPLLNPPESLSLIEEWWDTATMTSHYPSDASLLQ